MPVTVPCPNCRQVYSVAEEHLGREMRCAHCGENFTLDAASTVGASQQPTLDGEAMASPGGGAALVVGLLLLCMSLGAATRFDKLQPWFASIGFTTSDRPSATSPEQPAPTQPMSPPDENELPPTRPNFAFKPAPPVPQFTNTIGMKLVLIPAGKFTMGSPPDEKDRGTSEGPQQQVTITKAFYMGVHEVTQEEYENVMSKNPSYFSASGGGKEKVAGLDARHFPVETVSWTAAVEFCRKLSAQEKEQHAGCVYRLPTEAEWEYACRAGTSKPFHYGVSLSSDQANFNGKYPYGGAAKGRYLGRPTTVGSYAANAFGLYDMHGNVWEWCGDWYNENYYAEGARQDPQGPLNRTRRVLRGGSWNGSGIGCRAANCLLYVPGLRGNSIGFRVVIAARTP